MIYIEKIFKPLETIYGWLASLSVFAVTFLGDGKNMIMAVITLVLMDAIFGVWVSIRQDKFFLSTLARDTVKKLSIYLSMQICVLILDKIIGNDVIVCMRVTTAMIVVCEIWSILASVLIIQPNFLVANLLKKYLTGEIAKKMDIDKKDVEKVLEESARKKKERESLVYKSRKRKRNGIF